LTAAYFREASPSGMAAGPIAVSFEWLRMAAGDLFALFAKKIHT
jgi:hypothetical protein